MPRDEEGRDLRARPLAGDTTASNDVVAACLDDVADWLEALYPQEHPNDCSTAAADAILTAGCIDTGLPAGQRNHGQPDKPLIVIAHMHHAMWVTFSETCCDIHQDRGPAIISASIHEAVRKESRRNSLLKERRTIG